MLFLIFHFIVHYFPTFLSQFPSLLHLISFSHYYLPSHFSLYVPINFFSITYYTSSPGSHMFIQLSNSSQIVLFPLKSCCSNIWYHLCMSLTSINVLQFLRNSRFYNILLKFMPAFHQWHFFSNFSRLIFLIKTCASSITNASVFPFFLYSVYF